MDGELEKIVNRENPINIPLLLEINRIIEEMGKKARIRREEQEKIEILDSLSMSQELKKQCTLYDGELEKRLVSLHNQEKERIDKAHSICEKMKSMEPILTGKAAYPMLLAYQLYLVSTFDRALIEENTRVEKEDEGFLEEINPNKTAKEKEEIFKKYLDILWKKVKDKQTEKEFGAILSRLVESNILPSILPEARVVQVVESNSSVEVGNKGLAYLKKKQENLPLREEWPNPKEKEEYFHLLESMNSLKTELKQLTTDNLFMDYVNKRNIQNEKRYTQYLPLCEVPTNQEFFYPQVEIQERLKDYINYLLESQKKIEDLYITGDRNTKTAYLFDHISFYQPSLEEDKRIYFQRLASLIKEKTEQEDLTPLAESSQLEEGETADKLAKDEMKQFYIEEKLKQLESEDLVSKIKDFQLLFLFRFSKKVRNVICNHFVFCSKTNTEEITERRDGEKGLFRELRELNPKRFDNLIDFFKEKGAFIAQCKEYSETKKEDDRLARKDKLKREYEQIQEEYFFKNKINLKNRIQEIKRVLPLANVAVYTTKWLWVEKEEVMPRAKEVTSFTTNINLGLIDRQRNRWRIELEKTTKEIEETRKKRAEGKKEEEKEDFQKEREKARQIAKKKKQILKEIHQELITRLESQTGYHY